MSDYLSRIVDRAGFAPPTVRPALPSLFEPVKGAGTLTVAVHTARGMEPKAGTEHYRVPADEGGAESRAIRDRMASMNSILTAVAQRAKPRRSEEATELTSAELVSVPVAESATRGFAAESHAAAEPSTESSHQQSAVWPPTDKPAESAQRQSIVGDGKPNSHPLVGAEPTPATHRLAQGLPAAGRAASPMIPVLASVARPIAGRDHGRAPISLATDAEPSPTPTIRVTIGRVEVRAIVQPGQVTQPRARPAPKTSLEDYLRSRSGGAA